MPGLRILCFLQAVELFFSFVVEIAVHSTFRSLGPLTDQLALPNRSAARFHSFTSRNEQDVASLNIEAAEEGLTISPDRHTILFTAAIRNESNIMVATEFR